MLNAPVHKEAPNRLIGNDQASAIWTIRLVGLAQSVASIAGRRSLYPSRGNCDVRGMSTSLPLILRKRRLSRHSGTHTLYHFSDISDLDQQFVGCKIEFIPLTDPGDFGIL